MNDMRKSGGAMIRLLVVFVYSILVATASAYASEDGICSWQVKGVIKGLPGRGLAANEILVKHEPIPDYRDESGKVVGMMAMTMPFYVANSVSLDGISVGDSVELVVEQRIKPKFTDSVVSIKKVPPAK